MKAALALCYLAGAASAVITIHLVGRHIHRKHMEKIREFSDALERYMEEEQYRRFQEARSN